jgi:hypothetical protein
LTKEQQAAQAVLRALAKQGPCGLRGKTLVPDDKAGLASFLISEDARQLRGVVFDLEQFVMATMDAVLGTVSA